VTALPLGPHADPAEGIPHVATPLDQAGVAFRCVSEQNDVGRVVGLKPY
jgi:hypothetical protein